MVLDRGSTNTLESGIDVGQGINELLMKGQEKLTKRINVGP